MALHRQNWLTVQTCNVLILIGIGMAGQASADDARPVFSQQLAGVCDEVAEDLPECPCFLDPMGPGPGEWPPTLVGAARRNVVNVADRTLGTITSCWEAGGQPYWQMQLQFFGPIAARDGAVADPDMMDDSPREAWCTETIAYWHATASIPYWNGYQADWFDTKFVRNTADLRNWYKVAEERGERGRWIYAEELDYADFIPGVNGPCPGAYQQREGCDTSLPCFSLFYDCCWEGTGDAHSQLIDSVVVYRTLGGVCQQIDVFIIDGNTGRGWAGFGGAGQQNDVNGEVFNNGWVTNSWYPDVIQYTRLGDEFLGDDKIRGWGIDLDEDGNPICDSSRIRTVFGPFFRGEIGPGPTEDDEDSATVNKFMVYMGQTGGTKAVTTNSPLVQTAGHLPKDSGDTWVIPAGTHPVSGPVEIDVDLQANHPYAVRGVVIEWLNGIMPPTWEVWWSPQTVQIYTKTITRDPMFIPDPNTPSIPYHVRFKPPTPTLPDTGYTLRYIKLRIPNPVPAEYRIVGVHYLYYNGPEEDADSVLLKPEPTCHCGTSSDPHGDVNRDGSITAADIIADVNIVFKGALIHPTTPICPKNRSDANCDGAVNSADIILTVNHVFKGGGPPCDPCS